MKKLPLRHRAPDGSIYVAFYQAAPCGAAFLFRPPFPVMLGFPALRVFNDGQPIFPAKPVGFFLHIIVILFAAVKLDPVNKRNGIQDKVVVQMVFSVQMRGYQHLIFFTPQLFCQPQPNLVRYFRRSLSGGKGLIPMVGYHAALLAEPLFDRNHFVAGCHGGAVYAGNKPLHDFRTLIVRFGFLRLFLLYRVFDHVGKSLRFPFRHIRLFIKGGVFRLIGIFYIHNELAKPAMHPPN